MSNARVNSLNAGLVGTIGVGTIIKEIDPNKYYDGLCEIVPSSEEKVLYTKDLSLKDNVVVKPIPYTTYENSSGGMTVIIG